MTWSPTTRRLVIGLAVTSLMITLAIAYKGLPVAQAQNIPTVSLGSRGPNVTLLQQRLQQWGYYSGSLDGVFGRATDEAVRRFQARNGITVDGVVGRSTWSSLGLLRQVSPSNAATPAQAGASTVGNRSENLELLARVIAGEAEGEPYVGQVAVGAVILNRINHPEFPNTLAGVVYQPHAFESVTNGLIWRRTPDATARRAAQDALNGWDPTYDSIFFWNPYKPVSAWIWSRPVVVQHGNHVFAH